jgi:uncharacterized membrane protein
MLGVAAVIVLGVMSGALIAEAAILVPYWRRLPPDEFISWYQANDKQLLRFFGPLEIVAVVVTAAACGNRWLVTAAPPAILLVATVLSLLVLAVFPLYFKAANASFSEGSIEPSSVPFELQRWARWHAARVVASTAAFVLAAIALTVSH